MRSEWRHYLREQARYAPYFGWAIALSAGFYLATTTAWHEPQRFVAELLGWVFRAAVIGAVVFLSFAAVYAALVQRAIRTGRPVALPAFVQVLIGIAATCAGIALVTERRFSRGLTELRTSFFIALLMVLVFFFHAAWRRSREDTLVLRAAAAEARTQALERQMRPHFLFNALNALAEMIESGHPEAAGTAHALSDLYRRILAGTKRTTAPLHDELEIVRGYLDLERVRFGERLKYSLDVQPSLGGVQVPSLALQTLVENAVKHGIAPSREGGMIAVGAEREPDGAVRLSVSNTGAPLAAPVPRDGTGLANTRERLDLLYGPRHGFTLESAGGCTVASFRVPARSAPDA